MSKKTKYYLTINLIGKNCSYQILNKKGDSICPPKHFSSFENLIPYALKTKKDFEQLGLSVKTRLVEKTKPVELFQSDHPSVENTDQKADVIKIDLT